MDFKEELSSQEILIVPKYPKMNFDQTLHMKFQKPEN